jgi:hypothetical protein
MIAFNTNTVEVKIYSSKKAMRRAIRRIGFDGSNAEAMVIPCTAYKYVNGKSVNLPLSSELYIHKKATMPVLVHETLHAATSMLRDKKKNINLGRNISVVEERLAYTQTAILQDILKFFFPKTNSKYDLEDIELWAKASLKKRKK